MVEWWLSSDRPCHYSATQPQLMKWSIRLLLFNPLNIWKTITCVKITNKIRWKNRNFLEQYWRCDSYWQEIDIWIWDILFLHFSFILLAAASSVLEIHELERSYCFIEIHRWQTQATKYNYHQVSSHWCLLRIELSFSGDAMFCAVSCFDANNKLHVVWFWIRLPWGYLINFHGIWFQTFETLACLEIVEAAGA